MRLRTLIDNINYVELVNMDNMSDEIMGISYNSKKTAPNDLFICLTGEHVDGHEYAEEAFDNGAIAFVVERRLNLDAPQIVVENTADQRQKHQQVAVQLRRQLPADQQQGSGEKHRHIQELSQQYAENLPQDGQHQPQGLGKAVFIGQAQKPQTV